MSQKRTFYIVIFLLLLFPDTARSSVVINEFQIEPLDSQWVELYNDSTESADLYSFIIDDSGGTEKYIIEDHVLIASASYSLFTSGKFNFNKSSSDEVRLFDKDSVLIDSKNYDSSPGNNITIGRIFPTSNDWGICTPTPNNNNNCYIPSLTPTLTCSPTPTLTVSPTQKPTVTLTPTISPKPTATTIPTKILPSPTSTSNENRETKILGISNTTDSDINNVDDDIFIAEKSEFDELTTSQSASLSSMKQNTASDSANTIVLSKKNDLIVIIFILPVIFFLAGGCILFYTLRNDTPGNNNKK